MTYPSQPGYPAPQYGGQPPQQPQQNNLWLIGGAVLTVLIVIMTVILLVVQGTQNDSNSGDGGEDPSGGTNETGDDGGNDGGDDGGDDGGSGPVELTSDACDAYDFGSFEDTYGALDDTSRSESSYNGFGSVDCSFYNSDSTGVTLQISDYETAEDASYLIESIPDYYNEDNGYELSEYTELGDVGYIYTQDSDGWKSIYIHVVTGSLEVKVNTTLWDTESIDEAAATAVLEDFITQSNEMFADLV
ncbi:hypothetical protein [Glycomyces niveus]|uniref:DUF3558 domain-containing protein n=1 Tax=Glycomyces niveus TaxID=2820287 RepID=A0ABS3U9Q4_9ACTN|nr:hypothetical protein [Glycomyces sp. NEAU-S30]MBO3735510.1 hypothetical protein [Glycomyces sp. NEAU-S30]